jgi:hypothetical protein
MKTKIFMEYSLGMSNSKGDPMKKRGGKGGSMPEIDWDCVGTEYPTCPYCHEDVGPDWGENYNGDHECDECGNEFESEMDTPSFTSWKKKKE